MTYAVYISPHPGDVYCINAKKVGGLLRYMPNLPAQEQLMGTAFESEQHEYATSNTVTAEMESKEGPQCFIIASKNIEPGHLVGFTYAVKNGFYLFSKTGKRFDTRVEYDEHGKVQELLPSYCGKCQIL